MRLPAIVLLILPCFSTTIGQLKQVVEDKGTFGLHVVDDHIANDKYLERENQLLLIGYRHIQLFDLTNFKVIETRPLDLPSNKDLLSGHSKENWTISPDGRRMVLIGLQEARTRTKTEANDGRLLFKQKLEYEEGTTPRSFDADETIVTDTTTLRPHPNKKIFLTTSNQFAKIFNSRTGELLQVVVEPLIKIDLMGKPKKTHGHTVLSGAWSKDGKALYVFSANRQSVSLWHLID